MIFLNDEENKCGLKHTMTDELFNGDPNLESYYDLQNSL